MFRKILVPLDASELSECSLPNVKAVTADCKGSEVILFGVVTPMPGDVSSYMEPHFIMEVARNSERTYKDYLDKIADKLGKDGITVKTAVAHGNAAEEILYYAEKNGVDLIIMSTHGRSGVARWTIGSVADRVLHHTMVPVLLSSPKACRQNQQVY